MGIKHRRKFKEKKLQSPSDHRATMKTTTSITKHHNNHQPASDNCLSLSSPDLQIHFQIKSGDSIQTTLLTHCPNLNPNNPKKLPLVSSSSFAWRSSPCSSPTSTTTTACFPLINGGPRRWPGSDHNEQNRLWRCNCTGNNVKRKKKKLRKNKSKNWKNINHSF